MTPRTDTAIHPKEKKVGEIAAMLNDCSVIGLLNIHKMPARTFQVMRKNLRNIAQIKVTEKNILTRGFEKSGKVKGLEKHIAGEQGLLISNENPFRLFQILKENMAAAPAKAGDVAPNDIVVNKGPTNIAPGPAISTFQKAGLKTTVQQGKIAVAEDKVIVKAGETVTGDMASLMNLLKMEPMKIGLNLVAAWEGGVIYTKEVLNINKDDYIKGIEKAVQEMINLSVGTGFPTKEGMEIMISKAFSEAKALCIGTGIIESGFIDDALMKAAREAKELEALLGKAL